MDNFTDDTAKQPAKGAKYYWIGGLLLAGGLAAFVWLYSEKYDQVENLEQKLTVKETTYLREKDSLEKEIQKSTTNYNLLMADKSALNEDLSKEQAQNNRLISDNSSYLTRERQYKNENNALRSALMQSNAEKETLKTDAGSLRKQLEYMQSMLRECNAQKAEQAESMDRQTIRHQSDSIATVAFLDSLMREDVSGYFNNAELNGGYGLAVTSVPFANYYWGVTDINGYMIDKHWLAGLGVGLFQYDAGWTMPLYLDFRYTFNNKKIYTPYIFADGGFMIELSPFRVPNSVFMNPGLGLYRKINDNMALNLGAGLFVQSFNIRSSFVNVKVGFTFRKKK